MDVEKACLGCGTDVLVGLPRRRGGTPMRKATRNDRRLRAKDAVSQGIITCLFSRR